MIYITASAGQDPSVNTVIYKKENNVILSTDFTVERMYTGILQMLQDKTYPTSFLSFLTPYFSTYL